MAENDQSTNIEVRCIPDNPHAIAGILNTKRVRFDIETKSREVAKRAPLNLALVLDRSGSMESMGKFTYAKKAVIAVLDLLHDDDIVHLVVYDDVVSVTFENARAANREHLYSLVNQLETNGSTNISGAIVAAADLLEKHVHEGFSRRMFLFSDGQANVGMTSTSELTNLVTGYYNKGIITDSFGIGADFNSEVMKGIADAGGSRFYFLSSAEMIEALVPKALLCVFGVCASRVNLKVRGRNGATVTKIWGHDNLIAGASLGDLHDNNLRSILCEFTTSGTADTVVETLHYELKYNRPDDIDGTPLTIKNVLQIKFVDDESLAVAIDPRVQTLHVTQTIADMDKKIAELIHDNRRKEALEVVDEQIKLLKDSEKLDDDRKMISLLLQLAEHMQKKLKDQTVDRKIIAQGYHHHAHLMEECDEQDMGFGLFD